MNQPNDPREDDVEEFLRGGSELSRQYRSLAREEPPAELDQTILAKARDAVNPSVSNVTAFTERNRRRWFVPFALAATVLLTFAVVQETGIRSNLKPAETTASIYVPEPLSPPPLAVEVPPPSIEVPVDHAFAPAQRQAVGQVEDQIAGAVAANATSVLSSPPAMESKAERSELTRKDTMTSVSADTSTAAKAMEADAAPTPQPVALPKASNIPRTDFSNLSRAAETRERKKDKEAEEFGTPEAWLKDIRELRAAGKTVEAEAELKRFLELYPDYFEKNPDVKRP